MSVEQLTEVQQRKKAIRDEAHENRKQQENKEELSRAICEKFVSMPQYAAARTVMFYVDVRTEVRTRDYLATALTHGKKIVVPWCNDQGELELCLKYNISSLEKAILMFSTSGATTANFAPPYRNSFRLLPNSKV
jgi:5-formyltetrahydrofolate cyclo-ligase